MAIRTARAQARDAAYHFMSTMAGNLPQFEEASRALFADDRRRFVGLIADWPADIRDHIVKLAYQRPRLGATLSNQPHRRPGRACFARQRLRSP